MWTATRSSARWAALIVGVRVVVSAAPAWADGDAPQATEDALEALRERFRDGLTKYERGAYAEAIVMWDGVYRELGPVQGYRVAFDLGRAYDALGDRTRAAAHYASFLEQLQTRERAGEELDPAVREHAEAAQHRMDELAATCGRLHADARLGPVVVRIDHDEPRLAGFVAYVSPGTHEVVLSRGTDEERRTVVVDAGQEIELRMSAPAPKAPEPVATPARVSAPERPTTPRRERPFSPTVLFIAGGATAVASVFPILTYANALSIKSNYDNTSRSTADREALARDYEGARGTAYAALVGFGATAAITAGLTAYYFLATRTREAPVVGRIVPTLSLTNTGATVLLGGRL